MSTRASKRQRLDSPKVTVPTSPKKPVHLPSEILVDVALFLDRLDVDAIQLSCQRHRAFVGDNAHLIPLRDLAQISFEQNPPAGRVKVWVQPMIPTRPAAGTVNTIEFNGTWEEMLAEKDLFQNVVQYSGPHRLKLATPKMKWDAVSELFGDTPLTIRVSSEVAIGDEVEPNIDGIQNFLRAFALINCISLTRMRYGVDFNRVSETCDDRFLQWCTEAAISQLEVDMHGATLSDDVVLDFCFGPHSTDTDPRHLKALFKCSDDFLERLLETNRKCRHKGPITMDVRARISDAPNVAKLAPYRVDGPRRNQLFDETVFLLSEEFDLKITYFYHEPRNWGNWYNCRIDVSRPARQGL